MSVTLSLFFCILIVVELTLIQVLNR
jgi:hypothetical protein